MKIGSIVWGVEDIPRAVAFWSAALNYKLKREMSHDWAILVPVDGEVERLLALGAVKKTWDYPEDADSVVLQDPDGNPFCVVQKGSYK